MILGKATISNDGATIINLLDVVHPAAKTLVDIAKSQDAEVLYYSFIEEKNFKTNMEDEQLLRETET